MLAPSSFCERVDHDNPKAGVPTASHLARACDLCLGMIGIETPLAEICQLRTTSFGETYYFSGAYLDSKPVLRLIFNVEN